MYYNLINNIYLFQAKILEKYSDPDFNDLFFTEYASKTANNNSNNDSYKTGNYF